MNETVKIIIRFLAESQFVATADPIELEEILPPKGTTQCPFGGRVAIDNEEDC